MKNTLYTISLLITLSIVACNSPKETASLKNEHQPSSQDSSSIVNWTLVDQGKMYGAGDEGIEAGYHVIQDKATMQQLLKKMQVSERLKTPEDESFFDDYMLLFLFDKVRNTGGYHFHTKKITKSAQQVTVHTTSEAPSANAPSVMTQPFLIIQIDQSSLPIHYLPSEK